jgi:hypothetical protein
MPKIFEIFGTDVTDLSPDSVSQRRSAYCPFTEATCDGGGNRHQTKIKLVGSRLRQSFDESITTVIPGVCSIEYSGDVWIVCPRRLLGFDSSPKKPAVNKTVKSHEREALLAAGLPSGIELGVWTEVYLQYGDANTSINYHFDFVIAPLLIDSSFAEMAHHHSVTEDGEFEELKSCAKTGKYFSGKFDREKPIPYLPNLTSPFIVEVMTASTSGSDKEAGTDIAASFADAVLGIEHNCPGINKRQVWGRMATQLFAKSALAESWGGKTIWLVQDQLLRNIELTTKLQLASTINSGSGSVNFLSMKYKPGLKGMDTVVLSEYLEKSAGISFSGNNDCTDILLPKINPRKTELLKSVLRRKIAAIITL